MNYIYEEFKYNKLTYKIIYQLHREIEIKEDINNIEPGKPDERIVLNKNDLDYIFLCKVNMIGINSLIIDYSRVSYISSKDEYGISKLYFKQVGNLLIYSDNPEDIPDYESRYFNKCYIEKNKECTVEFYHTSYNSYEKDNKEVVPQFKFCIIISNKNKKESANITILNKASCNSSQYNNSTINTAIDAELSFLKSNLDLNIEIEPKESLILCDEEILEKSQFVIGKVKFKSNKDIEAYSGYFRIGNKYNERDFFNDVKKIYKEINSFKIERAPDKKDRTTAFMKYDSRKAIVYVPIQTKFFLANDGDTSSHNESVIKKCNSK